MIKLDYLRRRFPIVKSIPTVFESCLTVEEQIYCIYNYIQDVLLPAHNTNASAIEEIQEVLDTLQPYVNNKLDEMMESGQFQEFIESEVFQDFNERLGTAEEDIVENTQNINANALEIQKLKEQVILTGNITVEANEFFKDINLDYPDGYNSENSYFAFTGCNKNNSNTFNNFHANQGSDVFYQRVGSIEYVSSWISAQHVLTNGVYKLNIKVGTNHAHTEDEIIYYKVILKKFIEEEEQDSE